MSLIPPNSLPNSNINLGEDFRQITNALAAPFEAHEVKYKPQSVKGNRAMALAYVDVRVIQDRLDEVLGVENWQDEFELLADNSVMCRLRLKIGKRWITKMDVGSPSEQPDSGDRLKAAFSDALKRAAVKFGIGRYLYRLPQQWVDYDPARRQFVNLPKLPHWAQSTKAKQQATTARENSSPKTPTTAPTAPTAPTQAKPSAPPTSTPKKEDAPPVPPEIKKAPEIKKVPEAKVTPVPQNATEPKGPPEPKLEKPSEKQTSKGQTAQPPVSGADLHRRLRDYDAELAAQGRCMIGSLLAHITQAGIKAGFSADLTQWTGPAIEFAIAETRAFKAKLPPQVDSKAVA